MSTVQPPYQSLDPATGEIVAKFETATDDQVAAALTAADDAYRSWREESLDSRLDVARTVGRLLRERADDLAALARLEMGKKLDEGLGEVTFSASIFEFYASQGTT